MKRMLIELVPTALLLCVLVIPPLYAQHEKQPDSENSSVEQQPASRDDKIAETPPPTLHSEQEIEVVISEENPASPDLGHFKTFRYGAVSEGTVTITVSGEGEKCRIRIMNDENDIVKEAVCPLSGTSSAMTFKAMAGQGFRILIGATDSKLALIIKMALVEEHYDDGVERIDRALREARRLLEESKYARKAKKYTEARQITGNALAVITGVSGCQQSEKSATVLWNVGLSAFNLEDYVTARDAWKMVLDIRRELLAPDDPNLLNVRYNLGAVMFQSGDIRGAKEIFEEIVDVLERTLPPDHLRIQMARHNLATAIFQLGDIHKAKALYEKVLAVYRRLLPANHTELQKTRHNLAYVLKNLGDLSGSKALEEKVLEIYGQSLPADHPEVQKARLNLSATIKALGDFHGAKALEEKVLKVYLETLPPDNVDLQSARTNLSYTLHMLGEYREAKVLLEKAVEIYKRVLPEDHPHVQGALGNLAQILYSLNQFQDAKEIQQLVMDSFERTLPPDHPDLQLIRLHLAATMRALDDPEAALPVEESVLEVFERTLPNDHPELQRARIHMSQTTALLNDHDRSRDLIQSALSGATESIDRMTKAGSVREIDELVNVSRWILDHYLSIAPEFAPSVEEVFLRADRFRCTGARTGLCRRLISQGSLQDIAPLQEELLSASRIVASSKGTDIIDAVRRRDMADRALADAISKIPGAGNALKGTDRNRLMSGIPEGWIGISIQRYNRIEYDVKGGRGMSEIPSYVAFLVRNDAVMERLELGPAEPTDFAVEAWRKALSKAGSGEDSGISLEHLGRAVTELVWNPMREKLKGTKKLIIAPDAVLATIPIEALPDGTGVFLDNYLVVYADSLSTLTLRQDYDLENQGTLVALGGIDYDSAPEFYMGASTEKAQTENMDLSISESFSSCLRSAQDVDASPLPNTAVEAETVSSMYRKIFHQEPVVLQGARASKHSLIAVCPHSQYLHIATHGYFCSEDVRSTNDLASVTDTQFFTTLYQKITGLAPSLLCGLKLAGCNRPKQDYEDEGIISAEEIQNLDLTKCGLAVLSACETNVGLARAGQGIMSLQRALKIAGARGSITSLWKVDDQATLLLFTKFYEFIWKEKMHPAEALRRSKRWLRNLTMDDVVDTLGVLPGGSERGEIRTRQGDLSSLNYHIYDHPYFWASFVYWGDVE